MAEEPKSSRSSDSRRRRRYFKRKGDRSQGGESVAQPSATQHDSKRADAKHDLRAEFRVSHDEPAGGERRSRNMRKRRRSRSRRTDLAAAVGTATVTDQDTAYVAPQSVYVYEHIVRPSSGSSYEFRSEHFSKVGRTLDDYSLDLSIVFDPPAREPVGQIIARVFAEFEAADAIEAARAEQAAANAIDYDSATATPLGATGQSDSAPWLGPNEEFAGADVDETQEDPPKDD